MVEGDEEVGIFFIRWYSLVLREMLLVYDFFYEEKWKCSKGVFGFFSYIRCCLRGLFFFNLFGSDIWFGGGF